MRRLLHIVWRAAVLLAGGCAHYGWDHQNSSPRLMQLMRSAATVPVSRYSFETIELFKDSLERWAKEIEAERAKATGATRRPMEFRFYPVELHVNNLADEEDRRFFNQVPTRLALPAKSVDRLPQMAAKALTENEVFAELLLDLKNDQPDELQAQP